MKLINIMIVLLFCIAKGYSVPVGIGIGGGGAMSGISFDPYLKNHVFVGTDMGLVYESFDLGAHWQPISQEKISFSADLSNPSHMGFDPFGNYYWVEAGCDPKMSMDKGQSWQPMHGLANALPKNCTGEKTRVQYWFFSDEHPNFIGVGTSSGLLLSNDKGRSWGQLFSGNSSLSSIFIDKSTLAHATNQGIYYIDLNTLDKKLILNQSLSAAAFGKDKDGLTIVGVEKSDKPHKKLFIKAAGKEEFSEQVLPIGPFIRMAPTNSSLIYFTGNQSTDEGAAIWISEDKGKHWTQRYTNDEDAYRRGIINPNPIGLFVGFWDNGYHDFQVSPNNPDIIAGSANFFFKISTDKGLTWKFPYSKMAKEHKPIVKDDAWESTQLNPIAIYSVKRNPANSQMIVTGLGDITCILSMDNGASWRMCNIPYMNSIYDFEFNPNQPNQIYAAASTVHEFPRDWQGDVLLGAAGGIYVSNDAGVSWRRFTPDTKEFSVPYLSIAIDWKATPCNIYAGTQGKGIIASFDCGLNWQWLNNGFEPMETSTNSSERKGALIFPSIKISPITGEIYALHSGNRFWKDESDTFIRYTGLYKLDKQTKTWKQLGHPNVVKAPGNGGLYWKYPIDFDVDWNNPNHLYVIDTGAGVWKIAGVWFSPDEGKTWTQVKQIDYGRKIKRLNDAIYVISWTPPGEPFIFRSRLNGEFEPMNLRLPLQALTDGLIENDQMIFSTDGGGLFRIKN